MENGDQHEGVFPNGWLAIASGAVARVLLNLKFLIFKPPRVAESGE